MTILAMYVLGQTVMHISVLGKVVAYGDEWFGNESVGKRDEEITIFPAGNQAVPTTEPDWDFI